jgi:acetylornithine deacetylase/succinyl-diaminopimelate desuccinylase-like protein
MAKRLKRAVSRTAKCRSSCRLAARKRQSGRAPEGRRQQEALLLLAHIDVVEANREDWERDPFKLVEENGMFYARGASDDKAMAASFVNNMLLYKKEKLPLKRDIIMALTCDEEMVPTNSMAPNTWSTITAR